MLHAKEVELEPCDISVLFFSSSTRQLQAKESIEQLVYLCQTDKEAVREAAKQSLLLCGEYSFFPLDNVVFSPQLSPLIK